MAVNPLAVGGGVVVAAAAIGGGVYASGALSSDNKQTNGGRGDTNTRVETPWTALSKDEGYFETNQSTTTVVGTYKGKYGDTYGRFLVGKAEGNSAWWQEALANYKAKKSTAKGKFKSVSEKATDDSSLKAICDAAYKEENTANGKIKASVTDESTEDFLEDNIWEFCSPVKTKIKSITDEGQNANTEYTHISTLGVEESKAKSSLVSTSSQSEGNKWFWKWIDKELKDGERTTLLAGKKSVLDWCKAAYKANSLDSNISKANIFKWCSLTGREPA